MNRYHIFKITGDHLEFMIDTNDMQEAMDYMIEMQPGYKDEIFGYDIENCITFHMRTSLNEPKIPPFNLSSEKE